MNFWEHPSWIEAKTAPFTTETVLSRTQFLKLVGSGNYSENSYQKYLEAMSEKALIQKQKEEETDGRE
jgi:hypothetical protein